MLSPAFPKFLFALLLSLVTGGVVAQQPLKDFLIAVDPGPQSVQGLGVVVGLGGSGDRKPQLNTSLQRQLRQQGINPGKTRNLALVVVNGAIPFQTRKGGSVRFNVASVADAKSLQGGVLLQTQLTTADGRVWAIAEGSVQLNGQETDLVASGQVLGRTVLAQQTSRSSYLYFDVKGNDSSLTLKIVQKINQTFSGQVAEMVGDQQLRINGPRNPAKRAQFKAQILGLSL